MSLSEGITLVFPAYNEEANIAETLSQARDTLRSLGIDDYEIVVVDDGSRDRTAAIVRECSAENPRVRLVSHPRNLGYGEALLSGFQAATKTWVFVTDSDLQFDLSELELLLPHRQTATFIQGYRKRRQDPWVRIQLGRVYRTGIHLLFGLPVRDPECSFRLIRTDLIRGITLESRGAFVCSELIYKAKRRGAVFAQVGVSHHHRQRGVSSAVRWPVLIRLIKDVSSLFVKDRIMGGIRRRGEPLT